MTVNNRWKSSAVIIFCFLFFSCNTSNGQKNKAPEQSQNTKKDVAAEAPKPAPPPVLDTNLYKKALLHLVKDSPAKGWPVKTAYPLPGALLPFNRIVAYYGNFYSVNMGILGELPPDVMLDHLMKEVKKWREADTATPVIPAIHYIAVTAQGSPGKGGKYRMRMPFSQIDKALDLAKRVNGILFLDVQVGQSTVRDEIPLLDTFLAMPNVHLAIDPEFSMKTGRKPGSIIGTFDAADINYVSEHLAELVKKHNLPPKILVVHRFTRGMVTNYKNIAIHKEVQMVIDMDGWGFPAKKVSSYQIAVQTEPVQFSGFKLFYKNDIKNPPNKMMKPEEVLRLYPKPIYIQYQ